MRSLKNYARTVVESLDVRKVYKWASCLCAAAALVLAVNEHPQPDPFVNLDPNSPATPIVKDVFENGKQTGPKTKKKNYCFVPRSSGDDYMDAEIKLDERGYPTGSLKVTTLDAAPMNTPLQDFPDLDGNGDCDGDNPKLDRRYQKILDGIKEDIKYRKMAIAVFNYVEKNGTTTTAWEPLFPNISWLSFLGWDVKSQDYYTMECKLDDGNVMQLSASISTSGGRELLIGNLDEEKRIDDSFVDMGVLGYAVRDEKTHGYRNRLERVTQKFGIEVEK